VDATPRTPNSARWQELVPPYQQPRVTASAWQLANTLLPLAACWVAAYRLLEVSYALSLLCCLLATGLVVRVYIFQHDCGHGSFFKSTPANDVLGSLLGLLTLMPYFRWRHDHSLHHAASGNLKKRGAGDVWTLTVAEYRARTPWGRFAYRLYRHPLVLFGVGPGFLFLIWQRFTDWTVSRREIGSVYGTNLAVAAAVVGMGHWLGYARFLAVQLPITLMASAIAVWLFYMQHQFPETYWATPPEWDYAQSALRGASWYRLPKVLQWFTGNIGIHHIHHLSPKIPNYELQRCLDENPVFQHPGVVTFWAGFRCANLKLWDEERQRLVGFAEAERASEPLARSAA